MRAGRLHRHPPGLWNRYDRPHTLRHQQSRGADADRAPPPLTHRLRLHPHLVRGSAHNWPEEGCQNPAPLRRDRNHNRYLTMRRVWHGRGHC